MGKSVRFGVWESGRFVGAIVFSNGSKALGSCLDLSAFQVVELSRIALSAHEWPVTRMVRFALAGLRKACPGIRAVISFADPHQGHHGGIYQAGGWSYVGTSAGSVAIVDRGREFHPRSLRLGGWGTKIKVSVNATKERRPGKHRYVQIFDRSLVGRLESIKQQPPKRLGSRDVAAPGLQPGEGGSNPTPGLHE